jgi:RNA polymerase sigma-70 factor (ECF subfamily)
VADLQAFHELFARVRHGDRDAIVAFVREYEPFLLRSVRRRFGSDIRAAVDSVDVCQSVLLNFFVRVANGEFEFSDPDDVKKLLATMVRNKVTSWRRREGAGRRDRGRTDRLGEGDEALADSTIGPSTFVADLDLVRAVRERLTAEERQLVALRDEGLDWDAIAVRLGGTATVLRKRLSRALDRVARELGLDDGDG